MIKRLFLFFAVNMLVIVTLSLVLNVLGIGHYLNENGIDYRGLLAFCAVWGFGGAFISLGISRIMAKMMMGVKVIDPSSPGSAAAKDLVQRVHRLSQKVGLTTMPEVGIYESPEVNAFATGPSKNRALVAVSTGLLNRLDDSAVEGVLGHEVAHIANGDMVTMTLLQGIINTFVMFIARIAAWAISQAMSSRDSDSRPSPWINYMLTMVFEILLSFLGWIVLAFFSRHREFRADAGSAKIAGKEKMIHALQSLKSYTETVDDTHQSVAALKINGHAKGLVALLATHPPLEARIDALRRGV